jgi:signal transduction histidine kinase
LRNRLVGEIERDLEGRASRFESYFRTESAEAANDGQLRDELQEFCQALPPTSYIDLRGASGFAFRYPPGEASPARAVHALRRQFSLNGEQFDLEAGASLVEARHTLELLRVLLWSLLPVVIGVACAGGAWLSGRALKPVRDITAAALTISIENLSERLPVPGTGDDLARLTEVLNTMLARLEAAVHTLSRFVADASHELRTPLAVIRTTAELALRRARTPDSYRESLQEVTAEAERMTLLVENLLILARSDTVLAFMPLSPTDIREVLLDVVAELRSLAEKRQIRLILTAGQPAVVSGNRAGLRRLFLALLDNALKYSPEGNDVHLTVEHLGSRVSVDIRDHGRGIVQTDLPHIFKRFYRGDPARSDGGHGLGLALAQSIARAHDAAIEVSSEAGVGSLFRVVFASREARTSLDQTENAGTLSATHSA